MSLLTCICCRRELEQTLSGVDSPREGLVFTSYGGYGSTLFDSTHSHLRVVLCDECVDEAGFEGIVQIGHRPAPRHVEYRLWTGTEDGS